MRIDATLSGFVATIQANAMSDWIVPLVTANRSRRSGDPIRQNHTDKENPFTRRTFFGPFHFNGLFF
jgi:hypothetical protein